MFIGAGFSHCSISGLSSQLTLTFNGVFYLEKISDALKYWVFYRFPNSTFTHQPLGSQGRQSIDIDCAFYACLAAVDNNRIWITIIILLSTRFSTYPMIYLLDFKGNLILQ